MLSRKVSLDPSPEDIDSSQSTTASAGASCGSQNPGSSPEKPGHCNSPETTSLDKYSGKCCVSLKPKQEIEEAQPDGTTWHSADGAECEAANCNIEESTAWHSADGVECEAANCKIEEGTAWHSADGECQAANCKIENARPN